MTKEDAKTSSFFVENNFRQKDIKTEKTDEKDYQKRLSICLSCDNLLSGTCLSCGCYVEIRAAIKRGRCPDKKW